MDMLDALRLQIEWGADEALADVPIDRMAPPAVAPPAAAPAAASPGPLRTGLAARAAAAAAAANTVEALVRVMTGFTECSLAATATRMALSDGDATAGLVLLGEVASAEEDVAGRPFAGPSGALLDRMLASVGLARAGLLPQTGMLPQKGVLLINMVPWRPPGGRAPTDTEVQICAAFLWRHLTLLRPGMLVALGTLPARMLSGRDETARRLRGRWLDVSIPGLPRQVPALMMQSPASLQANPALKKDAWKDLLSLRRNINLQKHQS